MNLLNLIMLSMYFVVLYVGVYWIITYLNMKDKTTQDPKPSRHPSISIIIPTYNEARNIKQCIDSCLNLNYPKEKLEIIVVDDGSTDNTKRICQEYVKKKRIKYFYKRNTGKPDSLNRVIPKTKGELITVLDADSLFTRNSLKRMVGYFNDQRTGAVIPSIKVYKPKSIIERVQQIEYLISMFLRKMFSNVNGLFTTHGAGSLFRKDLILKVGGFDKENLTEDMDIALKIAKQGKIIKSSINSITYTRVPKTLKELYHQRTRWYVGYIHNVFKYKEMLLNPEYAHVGLFTMPVGVLSIAFMFLATLLTIHDLIKFVNTYVNRLLLTNFDLAYFFKTLFIIPDPLFSVNLMTLMNVFLSFAFFITLYLTLKVTTKKTKFSWKSITFLIIFYSIYFALTTFFWSNAVIIWLVKGGRRTWRSKKYS